MQLNRCPVCHARIGLEALVQDEAGRELLGLLCKLDTESGSALVGYLSLFRSSTRDLANAKALKLAKSVLALASIGLVTAAMQQTLDSLHGKGSRALTNHNYLKKVLEDRVLTEATPIATALPRVNSLPPRSKTAQAVQALREFGHE